MSDFRGYQFALDQRISGAWSSGARNVLASSPTGSGKTVVFSHILKRHQGFAVAIAHRQELVGQISLSLANEGVRHSIIAPRSTIRWIQNIHREELGQSFYDPNARIAVAGVKSLVSQADMLAGWLPQVTLWVMDEAHHLLEDNQWGTAVALFPNARGLGVTATPGRADGKGLGRHADGVFDALVIGPSMRELIDLEYLSDFEIWVPPSDLDMSQVEISRATGDFKERQAAAAVKRSHIVGDVVKHYLARAAGKQGITFNVDTEAAEAQAAAFRAEGVPAAAVSHVTAEKERYRVIKKFRRGELMQLCNVDLFGEGFDLPAIEVVSFARPTYSYNLFVQQFGRGLRIIASNPGKVATILDHVNNVERHNGPPDIERMWTLDRREGTRKGARDPDVIPCRTCVGCTRSYRSDLLGCPYCGLEWTAARHDGPEFVEGDLVQLDRKALEALYGEVRKVDRSPEEVFNRMSHGLAPAGACYGARNAQAKRIAAQQSLRAMIGTYGTIQNAKGRDDREGQKRFFYRYGIDVLSAQALGRAPATQLAARIIDDIGRADL